MSLWSRTGFLALLVLMAVLAFSTAGFAAPIESTDVRDPSPGIGVGTTAEMSPDADVGATAGLSVDTGVESTAGMATNNHTISVGTNTTLRLLLQPDGDARWLITKQFNVTTDNQTAAFEELAEQFEDGETPGSGLGLSAFQRAIELVDAETDREMEMREINRSASTGTELVDGVGELTISFTWENFARFENEKLVIDDVLETEQGLWLSGLAENQRLIITAPEGYGIDDANTVPQNSSLHWEGPTTFDNTTLQATFIGVSGTDPTGTTTPPQNVSTPKEPDETSGLALGIGLLAALVVIVLLATNRERIETVLIEEDDDGKTETAAKAEETDAAAAAGGTEAEQEDDDIDVELLSDEERVERLLERNGGRMKQANIVKETDWSNAKVSQLLSSMEDEGRIDKLRIGRENLISFPDEDMADITDDE